MYFPGRATDFGRSNIFFSAAPTPVAINRYRADGDLHDFRVDADPDDSDNDKPTTLDTNKLDGEVVAVFVVVVDTQIWMCSGCKFLTSSSHAVACKGTVTTTDNNNMRWTAVRARRCCQSDAAAGPKGSAVRAFLKENPSATPKRDKVSSSSTDRPKLFLNGANGAQIGGRDTSSAQVKHPVSVVLEEIPAGKIATTTSDSTYAHRCNDIERGLDITKLECQLCQTMHDMRMHCCQTCKPLLAATNEWPRTSHRVWDFHSDTRYTTRGFLRTAGSRMPNVPIAASMLSSWTAMPRTSGTQFAWTWLA